jgi:hypothetical protein
MCDIIQMYWRWSDTEYTEEIKLHDVLADVRMYHEYVTTLLRKEDLELKQENKNYELICWSSYTYENVKITIFTTIFIFRITKREC